MFQTLVLRRGYMSAQFCVRMSVRVSVVEQTSVCSQYLISYPTPSFCFLSQSARGCRAVVASMKLVDGKIPIRTAHVPRKDKVGNTGLLSFPALRKQEQETQRNKIENFIHIDVLHTFNKTIRNY